MGRRVSKDPEVRKQEIVAAAFDLFREKGYDQVSVQDIVKKVGLVQGTFYYHFKSKYELLDAVVDYEMRKNIAVLESIATDEKLSTLEKVQATINLNPDNERRRFIKLICSEENGVLYMKSQKKMAEELVPFLTQMIEAGNKEGVLNVQYPRETVELLLDMQLDFERILANTPDRDDAYRLIRTMEDIYIKVLGVRPGSIRLIS
jgi:AcrR family transcriptional regulator